MLACGPQKNIGVDIEQMQENCMDVAPAVYTQRELAWMAADPVNRFFRLWTWKESVMKALGLGLGLDPKCFDVTPFIRGKGIRIRGGSWYAFAGTLEGSPFSVCTGHPAGRPAAWEWIPAGDGLRRVPLNFTPFTGNPG